MKNDLLQKFLKDQELDEFYQLTNRSDEESRRSVLTCIPTDFVTLTLSYSCFVWLNHDNYHLNFGFLY